MTPPPPYPIEKYRCRKINYFPRRGGRGGTPLVENSAKIINFFFEPFPYLLYYKTLSNHNYDFLTVNFTLFVGLVRIVLEVEMCWIKAWLEDTSQFSRILVDGISSHVSSEHFLYHKAVHKFDTETFLQVMAD